MKSEESQVNGNSKSEEDENFLKICYPDSSKFMEVPLYEKGKILFVDVKLMEPKIIALKLIHGETVRLHKPVNGIFKEPAKKWGNFKVVAVLNDSINSSRSTIPTNIITSTVNSVSAGIKVTNGVSKPIKQEVSSVSKGNEFQLSTATSQAQTRQIKQETPNSTLESHAEQYRQSAIKSSGTGNVVVKQETLSIDRHNDEYIPSNSVQSNISVNVDESSFEGYEKNSFDFFTSSFIPLEQIDSFKKMKRHFVHRIIEAKLKLPFDDPLLFAKLFFLKQNLKTNFHKLKDIFPESGFCTSCNQKSADFHNLFHHTFSHRHVHTGLTQEELDKFIKAVSIIHCSENSLEFNSKPSAPSTNVGGLQQSTSQFVDQLRLPAPPLSVVEKSFSNQFYSESSFDKLKLKSSQHYFYLLEHVLIEHNFVDILLYRIVEADLKFPFIEDLFFLEKLLFLRENYDRIPRMKELFPITNFCKNCNKHLRDYSFQLSHILSNEHIRSSLTQEELNQLYEVLAEICYSDDGFYLPNIESKPQKRKMIPENSNDNVKRQRKG